MKFWFPALIWAGFIFYLSHQSHPPGASLAPDFVGHTILYSVLALTLVFAFSQGLRKSISGPKAAAALLIAAAYGAFDEFHQSFIGGRVPSAKDFLVDTVAAGITVLILCKILRKLRDLDDLPLGGRASSDPDSEKPPAG